jgi:hypothetical protein
MLDSHRYRYQAAECLLAAREAAEPCHRTLRLSMAASWLSLARQDEAMTNLLTSRNAGENNVPPSVTARWLAL